MGCATFLGDFFINSSGHPDTSINPRQNQIQVLLKMEVNSRQALTKNTDWLTERIRDSFKYF
jgi:hypothetical protein